MWRLSPGYYPGGLHLQGGTFYFEPGIYWIGGGGVTINGNGTTSVSVATGGTTLNFGVLFYNTENPAFHDACAAGTATTPAVQCIQPIFLNGAQASVDLYPLHDGSIHEGLVDDLVMNGSSSDLQVRGTIYIPAGNVRVNGSGGTTTTDQIIARTFVANGAPGSTIRVLFDQNFVFKQTLAGLVE